MDKKMIDTAELQAFLSKLEGGTVAVDLMKVGENYYKQHANGASGSKKSSYGNLRLAVDMEDCLDRFYGGYYSDWACGGQWNRALQFCQLLVNAFHQAHIEIIAFFDGTLKEHKKTTAENNSTRAKTISVIKHVKAVYTPPPKIWWLPPSGTRTCIRNALRSFNVCVVQTVHDHTMEVIEYCRDHKLDGILGVHPDYIIANTQRYFSSHDIRLSYKGTLETKEYLVSKLLTTLSLTVDHLPFIAVLLGGYILLNESILESIYKKVKIDSKLDFESRIKKIAELVRNTPTNDIDEFIKHLNLSEWANEVKETVEYYQRRGAFAQHKFRGCTKKKLGPDSFKETNVSNVVLASEASDNDELARNILKDVNSLVDDGELIEEDMSKLAISDVNDCTKKDANSKLNPKITKCNNSLTMYSIPIEVVKTSMNRHQRGIMDSRIYQLLTKKQLILPQILEDEHHKDFPSIHLFYRPARQLIYAILFNMYHQKYLCSKKEQGKNELPEISVSEWIWTPQNQYKKPEIVKATLLPWAVPTIQRLWFGTIYEDKQRRMKAFLTIMRSDTPLMLNRTYVPQHMYIITNPERNVMSRPELDAFLAVAFSPNLLNVEYTQELILPSLYIRGVYLATLFMQGVETASLANDACGIPLPWAMTNPWLFFDGKLFHLKLKMSAVVQNVRELCEDQIEVVMKIERFRKAILEDVDHYLPLGHIDPMHRSAFLPPNPMPHSFGNKSHLHSMANMSALANSSAFYNAPPYFPNVGNNVRQSNVTRGGGNVGGRRINSMNVPQISRQPNSRNSDYQLKVGGVVVGSWAGGVPNKPIGGAFLRYPRAGIISNKRRGSQHLNIRSHRIGMANNPVVSRAMSRCMYAGKVHKNRKQRRTKDKKLSLGSDGNTILENGEDKLHTDGERTDQTSTKEGATGELSNGVTILAAEQNDDKCKGSDAIPSPVQNNIGSNDDSTSILDKVDESDPNAISNNNNECTANSIKETKTNGNVVAVNTSVAGKNKKKNKKGKNGASNENGVSKEETEEGEVLGDTTVQV
ncbi:Constitutive coactivator of PPAR-gamma-like protein 1 [Pseudolycoriella hygida]|uniref:Constitutive coactivator of PPAR-gamma-like protein 1 n=1 Tax=Pseudolycoriella hygida TaxID=35572 RepID=A0A9Q0N6Y4_9DIPT|nr:Constitutive coactivator of PPAR-gamma-like protein 1 [Pseudolycoriella hygida]